MRTPPTLPRHQHGALLILLVIALGVLAAAVFVGMLSSSDIQNQRDKTTAAALAEAKAALIGFALANQNTPGGLPYPDRANDGNYDGHGDCVINTTIPFNNSLLLGKFPTLVEDGCTGSIGIPAFETDPRDAAGERVWYAVSQNLVKSEDKFGGNTTGGYFPKINTSTLITSQYKYPWLTVRDQNGNVLSNQVAFIIIAPGVALTGQSRSGAIPPAQNFLDNYTVNGTTYKNWDSDLDFISAPPTNSTANQFNDRLLYVTRNELMSRLVDRVAGEVRLGLNTYYLTYHTYPAKLTDITSLPSWFNANNWTNTNPSTADILYTPPPPPQPTPPSQVTIGFRGCTGVTYTFTWHSVTSNSDMKRNGSC